MYLPLSKVRAQFSSAISNFGRTADNCSPASADSVLQYLSSLNELYQSGLSYCRRYPVFCIDRTVKELGSSIDHYVNLAQRMADIHKNNRNISCPSWSPDGFYNEIFNVGEGWTVSPMLQYDRMVHDNAFEDHLSERDMEMETSGGITLRKARLNYAERSYYDGMAQAGIGKFESLMLLRAVMNAEGANPNVNRDLFSAMQENNIPHHLVLDVVDNLRAFYNTLNDNSFILGLRD